MTATASEFPANIVGQAWARSLGQCERCGRALVKHRRGRDWSAHHRKPRGSGGSSDPSLARVENCLIVCGSGVDGCHGYIEEHRAESYDEGYLVHEADDPAEIRVTLFLYGRVHLEHLGLIVP